MVKQSVESLFPHPSFREKQREVCEAVIKALWEDGYKNVVLDAPTGVGKSSINTTALRYADNGFYTTPVRSLREQLEADPDLQPYLESLKARKDYHCRVSSQNCEECPVYTSSERSCSEQGPKCSYWARKQSVMASDIAVITFSFLIIDGNIPTMVNEQQISFDDREVLVVDESQDLTQQTEEMHAGFKISPYSLPSGVIGNIIDSVDYDANMYEDVRSEVTEVLTRCLEYVGKTPPMDMSPEQKMCQHLADKIQWVNQEVENDNPWVVDVDSMRYRGEYRKVLELKPIYVSSFLSNFVWNRAEKRIISTATLPYRNNPEIWLRKVGLVPEETRVISVGMPFPVQNRPIHTSTIVGSMSSGGFDKQLDEALETMNEIAERHNKDKGLVHTSSYSRAEKIEDNVNERDHPYLHDNTYVHDQDRDVDVQIEEWQDSDYDMMLSPAMTEGVDLKGDMCRYQILAKVPYPSRGDSRTQYVLENEDWGWMEMNERTLIRVVQSYGRGVRSRDDYCDYYVLDKAFNKLLKKRSAPEWFEEAIDVCEPRGGRSVFDV